MTQDNISKLRDGGDARAVTLLDALYDVLQERGNGIPIPTVIGVIELLKTMVLSEALDDDVA
jgi:hypothetical protein